MDYKYIEQLLARYWKAETTVEEEAILRAFFSQKNIPAALQPYRDLFVYQAEEVKEDVLGKEFDEKIYNKIGRPVKARTIKMTNRWMPLFKAAAMVAIILAIGNGAQWAVQDNEQEAPETIMGAQPTVKGTSVAMGDSSKTDTAVFHTSEKLPATPIQN